jgi:hypothetical protein
MLNDVKKKKRKGKKGKKKKKKNLWSLMCSDWPRDPSGENRQITLPSMDAMDVSVRFPFPQIFFSPTFSL